MTRSGQGKVYIWEELGDEVRGKGCTYVQNTSYVCIVLKTLKLYYKMNNIINYH